VDKNSDQLKKALKDDNNDGILDKATSLDINFSHLEN
jgi:hypothetical protein